MSNVKQDQINKFTELRRRKEDARNSYVAATTRVESARERYRSVMEEVNRFGIGTYKELVERIVALETTISEQLKEYEASLTQLEEAAREASSQKASVASNS